MWIEKKITIIVAFHFMKRPLKKTQTVDSTHSTRQRERKRTGTDTKNTKTLQNKQKHTYWKINTKEKRLWILRTPKLDTLT